MTHTQDELLPLDIRGVLTERVGPLGAVRPVGGGSIARAFRVELGGQRYFLKIGEPEVARTFPGEAAGLEVMRAATRELRVPAVVGCDPTRGYLLLEWLEPARGHARAEAFWTRAGRGLAELHHARGRAFGFERDNHIGRTPQHNGWCARWPAFFRERRLAPQLAMARARGLWPATWNRAIDRLLGALERELPDAPTPSLVHGDLWGGNFMRTADDEPALFDPAAHYGHREVDLAMMTLFGGFDARMFEAYAHAWPLEPGHTRRREIYNLYHAINHLNLFGRGYASMVARHLTALQ